jgi:hypothetical protein
MTLFEYTDEYNQYDEARNIAYQLAISGFKEVADTLKNDLSSISSSTEAFMQISFYLSPIKNNIALKAATSAQIARLLENVDAALAR